MQNIDNITGDYKTFLDKVFKNLKDHNIDVSKLELDHLCYRVNSFEKYKEIKNKLASFGTLIAEKIVRGRPIAVFKLNNPLIYKNFSIPYIELPASKQAKNYPEGLEHANFVIDTSFEEFMEKYKSINFEMKVVDRKDPEISLKFKDCAVKFHLQDIEKIVKSF
ncbi:hypothetical protein COY23_00120 [bacterium (Candidatus Torokbacteria) CG_4_10_14_0_2_um_filter_35_8]|uniref:VOC domain-containing protein n=1 Tax=Candidatus Sherwoodlollariibacterium unditelluris TaxID=1974757 RepID=A0A2G9YIP5_9BACT|nr:MAG: hypothetical protein COX41_04580 [Candidatus Omnitrophica bacterium CG23_combo_of_CG06-09_8_20_14_all_41_10]PIZ58898.1 MAG: hypothetical protein COY23_00120 [bacterium (Candidatus Torokbacteria) CG_4_10_14_0_2_um_filter_35_8]